MAVARVLIVEDEKIIAVKTETDLISMGHEVIGVVGTGLEALDIAMREQPDLILMDIVLKGDMNGIETSKQICDESDCKIIFMTAHADEKTIEKAKQTKHVGFLHKPFEIHQLKMGLDKAMA